MNSKHEEKLECNPIEHRFFALELVGNQTTKKATAIIICTQCGKLVKHVVEVE
jgi:hypothetical protein